MIDLKMRVRLFLNNPFGHLFLVIVLVLLAYSNTFSAPFQWDEGYLIVNNPIIKDIDHFLRSPVEYMNGISKEDQIFLQAFKMRPVGYLSFALNYKLHGFNVTGYHITNITIHVLNGLLVYLLVILSFRTPFLSESRLKENSKYAALFSALLFVSHPVQTEAVTYVFQRFASLAAFFFLLSLISYISSRLSERKAWSYFLYALSLISAVLAMKTKENAFTLPLTISLYELFFFKGAIRTRIVRLIPLLLTVLIIPLALAGSKGYIASIPRGYAGFSRTEYLLTQFRVIVTYLRLLFLPINQNNNYNYPVFNSFLEPQVVLSFAFLSSIILFGLYIFHKSKRLPELRLIAFGIFWFFITLSVESSVIPIPMVINEYRVYLPSVGVFMLSAATLFLILNKIKSKNVRIAAIAVLVIIPLVLSYAAFARNSVWESMITLLKDNAQKSPRKAQVHTDLASAYLARALPSQAIEHLAIALRLNPDLSEAHYRIGIAYKLTGDYDKSIEHLSTALKLPPPVWRRGFYGDVRFYLGSVYEAVGSEDKAMEHYLLAAKLNPNNAEAHFRLGRLYLKRNVLDDSLRELDIALKINPNLRDALKYRNYIEQHSSVRK
jgi:tetratricopeptide (TPR) repeat protein